MYLVFDTETTGIPRNHDAPASDIGNWPRLVQIAWLLADAEGRELRSQAFISRPEGFVIPDGAVRVHGIDTETARQRGIEVGAPSTLLPRTCRRPRFSWPTMFDSMRA